MAGILSLASILSFASGNSNDSDEDFNDLVDQPTLANLAPVIRRKAYEWWDRRVLGFANRMPDLRFKRMYRMTRGTFQSILNEVGGFFSPGMSNNRKSITPPEKLLVFFKFLGFNHMYYSLWVSLISIKDCVHALVFKNSRLCRRE